MMNCPVTATALPPLALALRAATRAAHQRLDHHPRLQPLTARDLPAERYAAALAALHGLLKGTQDALAPRLRATTAYDPAAAFRCELIAADLAQLGGSVGQPAHIRAAADDASAAGMLDGVEGSALGARSIARPLAVRHPALPRRYFDAHAEHGAQRWPAFWHWAAQETADPQGSARACAAALALFDSYVDYLDGVDAQQK